MSVEKELVAAGNTITQLKQEAKKAEELFCDQVAETAYFANLNRDMASSLRLFRRREKELEEKIKKQWSSVKTGPSVYTLRYEHHGKVKRVLELERQVAELTRRNEKLRAEVLEVSGKKAADDTEGQGGSSESVDSTDSPPSASAAKRRRD